MPGLLSKADDEDMMKLHQVARKGSAEILSRLLRAGTSPNLQNKYGCTALHLTCVKGHVSVLRVLSECPNLTMNCWHGRYPIHNAVIRGSVDFLRELVYLLSKRDPLALNQPDESDLDELGNMVFVPPSGSLSPLHYAVALGLTDVTACLLEHNASLLSRDKHGLSPLMYAVAGGDVEVLKVVLNTRQSHLQVQDKKGATALHMAARAEATEVVELLMEVLVKETPDVASALLTCEDVRKETPLLLLIEKLQLDAVKTALAHMDPFIFQQLRFHDSRVIFADRIAFNSTTYQQTGSHSYEFEEKKELMIKLLKEKLEDCATSKESL